MTDTSPIPSLQLGALQMTGVASRQEPDGTQALRMERIEARDLTLQTPIGLVRAARAVLSNVGVRLRAATPDARPLARLAGLTAGELRLESMGIELNALARPAGGAGKSWRLDPLGALDGSVHADIADAAWIFDAKVTIPISGGRIDFNRATVEHVGPDSSLGISRTGIHVDAPNGRSYLYLLAATHVPGVSFERRGALLSSWTSDRGAIDLQPFAECVLSGVPVGAPAAGTREMLARTRMSAELRLGNGVIGDAGHRLVLTGRELGKNRIELSPAPSGPGFVLRLPELSAGELRFELFGKRLSAAALSAVLSVQRRSLAESALSASVAELTLSDLALSDAADS
jgi:hypothetical protein